MPCLLVYKHFLYKQRTMIFLQIRKTTANKLYEVLVIYDDVAPEENLDEIMTILSESLW